MPEPLKNLYNETFLSSLARHLKPGCSEFSAQGFRKAVFDDSWGQKELKQRMNHISVMLHEHLTGDYREKIEILKPVSSHFRGLEHMVFPAFVEHYGLGDFETSMSALEYFTANSSSEFAIRPFIKQSPGKTMRQMEAWAESPNHHVRRLASEGCRPRLPWAMALPVFKKDPRPVIKILNRLKGDESEYVRRSVANNLNDISKDNPEMVIDIARDWLGKKPEIDWVVKHACRSLLKQGEPQMMEIFGFEKPAHISILGFDVQDTVGIGGRLKFSFKLQTQKNKLGKLRIEYAIDFMKNNGQQKRKVFKISESDNPAQKKMVKKEHSFKLISTRKYYPGAHGIAIIINGHELINAGFQLADHN
jgi:3-methyladenine DNA glycosylase AlkC